MRLKILLLSATAKRRRLDSKGGKENAAKRTATNRYNTKCERPCKGSYHGNKHSYSVFTNGQRKRGERIMQHETNGIAQAKIELIKKIVNAKLTKKRIASHNHQNKRNFKPPPLLSIFAGQRGKGIARHTHLQPNRHRGNFERGFKQSIKAAEMIKSTETRQALFSFLTRTRAYF